MKRDPGQLARKENKFLKEELKKNPPGFIKDLQQVLYHKNIYPMFIFDTGTFQILDSNNCAVKDYGYSNDEFKSLKIPDLIKDEEQNRFKENLNISQKEYKRLGILQHKRKNGETFYANVILRGLDYNGSDACIVTIVDATHQINTEKTLGEQEELLTTLIDAMPDIVCFKDAEGRWLKANKYDLELFELTNIDYVGKTDSQLAEYSNFYKNAFLECEDSDEIAWQKKSLSRGEEIIPKPDGTKLIFDIIKVPLFYPNGSRKGLVVIGRDITERKKVENELMKFSHVVEQNPISILITDTEGNIEYVNPRFCSSSGYSFEEVIGKANFVPYLVGV